MSPGSIRAALAAMLVIALAPDGALAQGQGLQLDRSLGAPPGGRGPELPTFLTADRIEGLGSIEVEATGNAEIRRGDTTLTADRITYFAEDDEAEAAGNVRLRMGADEMTGPRLRMRIGDSSGIFEQPSFRFAERTVRSRLRRGLPAAGQTTAIEDTSLMIDVEGRGTAAAIRFEGDERYRITEGTFTTCKPGQDDWHIQAEELDIDMQRQVATARGASLTFLGATTPRIPWFDYSLNNERKSGFLPPTAGIQNGIGFEVVTPFYWNIAPNYDATIAPRYMARRGLQFLNQFRFLTPYAKGEARYEILPEDKSLGETRYATALQGDFNFLNGFTGLVNYQKVSDDNYFRDLSGRLSIATQTNLSQQALATYSAPTGYWSATANYQRFQTLQDPQNPVPIPYFREPQFLVNALRPTPAGVDLGFRGEFVSFGNSALVPTGSRTTAYPWVAWPLVTSYGFVKPKAGVAAIGYNLSTPGSFTEEHPSIALPITSLDSGLIFERDTQWFGTDYLQTLEPRAYYLYVPFRDQAKFPVFDTTTSDLNFSQLFQENIFAGGDRIANANQLSLGITSRFVRPSDGQEQVRATIGQRYFFADQKVTIPGQPVRTDDISPLIVGLAGRIAPRWTAELGAQYQFASGGGVERFVAGARYSPAPAAVASISYRYTNQDLTAGAGTIENVDVAAQWPLGGGLYGVGRYSYDLEGKKTVEALLGVEYNAGCWIIRAVAQKFQTATAQDTTLFFVQLEFNGLARIGSNPLEVLRRSIPGYSLINQSTAPDRGFNSGDLGGPSVPVGAGTRVAPIRSGTPGAYGTYD
ncbi:MAG: LPS-assembly protein LptD [Bacteroidota bacterium]